MPRSQVVYKGRILLMFHYILSQLACTNGMLHNFGHVGFFLLFSQTFTLISKEISREGKVTKYNVTNLSENGEKSLIRVNKIMMNEILNTTPAIKYLST